ncbi:hypothetical protein AB4P17_23400, partial [Escherichia coli]
MKYRLLILNLLVSVPAFAWQPQTGDIIFQISRSSQSKAIQLATHSDYSHTGMLVMRNAYSALFDHGLASKSDQRFASIRSTGNLTFS